MYFQINVQCENGEIRFSNSNWLWKELNFLKQWGKIVKIRRSKMIILPLIWIEEESYALLNMYMTLFIKNECNLTINISLIRVNWIK